MTEIVLTAVMWVGKRRGGFGRSSTILRIQKPSDSSLGDFFCHLLDVECTAVNPPTQAVIYTFANVNNEMRCDIRCMVVIYLFLFACFLFSSLSTD